MSSHSEELKILSFYGKREGPLAVGGHDTLFTASEVETPSSLFADHSVATSLDRGERLVCRMELGVQVGNPLLIHLPKERLPLLQLQHTSPIESAHLYDSMCRWWGLTTILCKLKNMSCVCFRLYVESSSPLAPFQSRLKRILVEASWIN